MWSNLPFRCCSNDPNLLGGTSPQVHNICFISLLCLAVNTQILFSGSQGAQPGEQGLKGSELVGTKTAAGKGGIAYEFS